MVNRGREQERNPHVSLGYCKDCESLRGITNYRVYSLGSDCMGEHWETKNVPLQCFSLRHEDVLKVSTSNLFGLQKFFGEEFISKFIKTLDNWPEEEGFPNKGNFNIYGTEEHKKLIELYGMWNNISEGDKQDQLSNVMILQHERKKLEDKVRLIDCVL